MPKCEIDPTLQEQVHRFMKENGLTISGVAAKWAVDRTTLWRFCDSGRGRSDTRAIYRRALEKHNTNTAANATNATNETVKADALTVHSHTSLRGQLASHELKLIRKACEGVLALIDAYEAQSLGRKN